MIQRLWVQTPLGAIFDEIYFDLCTFRSDRNVTETRLSAGLSSKIWKLQFTTQDTQNSTICKISLIDNKNVLIAFSQGIME